MREQALFINGIYRNGLDEILETQSVTPDETLFLQPYSASLIAMLRDNPPTIEDPVTLYASTTDDLTTVSYTAYIVKWEDKTQMDRSRRNAVDETIRSFQPTERGLFDTPPESTKPCRNLLSIQRLIKLPSPFTVTNLIKISDDMPLSTNRTRSGGWSPVHKPEAGSSNPVEELLAAEETAMVDSGIFDPDSLEDARKRIAVSIIQRRGQPEFRRKLLEAYGRRCAVTGCDVEAALEACHIIPYKGPETNTNHTSNGLLLRADLHALFDLGLIAFDLEKQETLVAERLQETFYKSLAGQTMSMPSDPTLRPNKSALKCHRKQAGL